MSETVPHSTPDQIRAAEKRATAAREASGDGEKTERSSAPKGRKASDKSES